MKIDREAAKKLYEHVRIWQIGQRPQVVDHLNPSDISNLALFLVKKGWAIDQSRSATADAD